MGGRFLAGESHADVEAHRAHARDGDALGISNRKEHSPVLSALFLFAGEPSSLTNVVFAEGKSARYSAASEFLNESS